MRVYSAGCLFRRGKAKRGECGERKTMHVFDVKLVRPSLSLLLSLFLTTVRPPPRATRAARRAASSSSSEDIAKERLSREKKKREGKKRLEIFPSFLLFVRAEKSVSKKRSCCSFFFFFRLQTKKPSSESSSLSLSLPLSCCSTPRVSALLLLSSRAP